MTALTLEGLTKTFQRAGTVVDSIDLAIKEGEFFTLLGPSGCGKSTILRMIAGFEEPTLGRVLIGQRDITHDPPNRRGIGLVFQNYALFPHMSVARNVSFGLELRRLPKSEIESRVAAALEQVQLSGLGSARIDQLSGGQQQRVALARALVIRPSLLLLDEPLSNLDAKLREETRAGLRALHSSTGVTTVYVTHDQAEAMGMSDRIAVLNAGRLQQVAVPEEVYERPANRFVANFIGRNNVLEASIVEVQNGAAVIRFPNGPALRIDARQHADRAVMAPGARVGVCLRAETLQLTSGAGIFSGVVTDVEYIGAVRWCTVDTGAAALRVEVPGDRGRLTPGEVVHVSVRLEAVHLVEWEDAR